MYPCYSHFPKRKKALEGTLLKLRSKGQHTPTYVDLPGDSVPCTSLGPRGVSFTEQLNNLRPFLVLFLRADVSPCIADNHISFLKLRLLFMLLDFVNQPKVL